MKPPSKLLYSLLISCGVLAFAVSSSAFEDPASVQEPFYQSEKIFTAGEGDYHSFRIPSLIKAQDGSLIAFCEGRVRSSHDFGNIDIVAKRSSDHGATWGKLEIILHSGYGKFGNPTSALEDENGTIFLFVCSNAAGMSKLGDTRESVHDDGFIKMDRWGDRRLLIIKSSDNGKSWSKPRDMTDLLSPKTLKWDAVGPGNGIQIREGRFRGRLVVPAIGRNIFSDDLGKTWNLEMLPEGTSESTIVEVNDGLLMRNDRGSSAQNKAYNRRMVSAQKPNGTWPPFKPAAALLDPICHASMLRYTGDGGQHDRIIFLNPADTKKRSDMTLRLSYDGGKTWPVSRALIEAKNARSAKFRNHGGYSAMTKTADRKIGILYEYNEDTRNPESGSSIIFSKVNLGWLLERAR